jgi:hypothetical protein
VTPSRASIETVKAVPKPDEFSASGTIIPSRSLSSCSSASGRQIRPRPKRAMKLIASGVTFSAAMQRSPSFSRSSSSTRTTMRPARISSSADSIGTITSRASFGSGATARSGLGGLGSFMGPFGCRVGGAATRRTLGRRARGVKRRPGESAVGTRT